MHIERASFQHSWYSAVKATKTIPRADGHGLHTVNGKVGGILDSFFMPQDLVKIQVDQPQKEDNYQEYTELENLDGFRCEADIYV